MRLNLKNIWKKIQVKYKTFKLEYLNRSPREKWLLIRDIGTFFLKWCGAQILDPNFKVWWYSYAPTIVTIDIFISFFYTFWYFMESNLIRSFLCIPVFFGILIPVKISRDFIKLDYFYIKFPFFFFK